MKSFVLRRTGFGTVRFFLLLSAFSFLGACTRQESRVLNRAVIEVNGTSVTAKDFANELAHLLKDRDPLTVKDPQLLTRAKNDLADQLVLKTMIYQWAGKNGLTVSEAEVEARVSQIRSEYSDELAFRKQLADEKITLERWKEDLKSSLLKRKVWDRVTQAAAKPTDAELKATFEAQKKSAIRSARVRIRQIVLEKEDDAKRVLEELGKGRDFKALARKFSIAPEAQQDGDTGWVDKGVLDIFDQAYKMPVGARSKILKSPYGWHILEVIGKEPEKKLSFDQLKSQILADLTDKKKGEVFNAWLDSELRKSVIKRDEALLKSLVITTRTE